MRPHLEAPVSVGSTLPPAATPLDGLALHPLADVLPAMPLDEFIQLKEDIRVHGLRLPVLIKDGLILDGRHRAQACTESSASAMRLGTVGDDDPTAIVSASMIPGTSGPAYDTV